MATQTDFVSRIKAIERTAHKTASKRRRCSPHRAGRLLVTPLMMLFFTGASMVYAWDMADRPTNNPFHMASSVTAQLLAYLG